MESPAWPDAPADGLAVLAVKLPPLPLNSCQPPFLAMPNPATLIWILVGAAFPLIAMPQLDSYCSLAPPAAVAMRITSKGQVTIPQAIREQCGLLPHTEVRFELEEGRLLLVKQDPPGGRGEEGLRLLRQARLRTRLSTDELLALCRGEEH